MSTRVAFAQVLGPESEAWVSNTVSQASGIPVILASVAVHNSRNFRAAGNDTTDLGSGDHFIDACGGDNFINTSLVAGQSGAVFIRTGSGNDPVGSAFGSLAQRMRGEALRRRRRGLQNGMRADRRRSRALCRSHLQLRGSFRDSRG
ncbi:MAG: hypothetical protein N2653_01165 [Burkholderiales bacterium]|nr:hypothetical protein [Burkholderiales bacterium]